MVSYDVWEEKFSVTSAGVEHARATNLSPQAAEAWCLDHLALGIDGVAPERPFWVRLELRAEDARDQAAVVGDSGINLARLIELFSNPARPQQMHWEAVAGPVRLGDCISTATPSATSPGPRSAHSARRQPSDSARGGGG